MFFNAEFLLFEDKIEVMNKQPNAADDNSGFEKRVYTVEDKIENSV